MALDEKSIGVARLFAGFLPDAVARIIGEQQEPAGSLAHIRDGPFGGEKAEDFRLVAAFEICPSGVEVP